MNEGRDFSSFAFMHALPSREAMIYDIIHGILQFSCLFKYYRLHQPPTRESSTRTLHACARIYTRMNTHLRKYHSLNNIIHALISASSSDRKNAHVNKAHYIPLATHNLSAMLSPARERKLIRSPLPVCIKKILLLPLFFKITLPFTLHR